MPAEHEFSRDRTDGGAAEGFLDAAKKYNQVRMSAVVNAGRILDYMEDCRKADVKVSMSAVIIKALALIVREHPEARTIFFSPPPRLVLFDECTGATPIERDVKGEKITFLATLKDCDRRTIVEIASDLERFRNAPPGEIPEFRWMLAMARLPRPARRAILTPLRHVPFLRARSGGTFGYVEPGADSVDDYLPLAASTVTLVVGTLKERPLAENGVVVARKTIAVTMMFDRRAMDDVPAARVFEACIRKLETPDFTRDW